MTISEGGFWLKFGKFWTSKTLHSLECRVNADPTQTFEREF